MIRIDTYIYLVVCCWNYEESDIVFCSLDLNDCKWFIEQHRELKKYSPKILKVKCCKSYFHGIRRARKIKY